MGVKEQIVEQAKSVLSAGGTVYIGETHSEDHARELCFDILKARVVQFFCMEIDKSLQNEADLTDMLAFQEHSAAGHRRERKGSDGVTRKMTEDNDDYSMAKLIKACGAYSTQVICYDNQLLKPAAKRQKFIAENIKNVRAQLSSPARGCLVLVGDDHLDKNGGAFKWDALQGLVYGGLTVTHASYGSSRMMWQLS
jgi:hypothetical protein